MKSIVFFLPETIVPLLFVGAAFALIFSMRKFAGALFIVALIKLLSPMLLDPIVNLMPIWVLLLLAVFVGLFLFRSFAELLLGKEGAGSLIGSLAADFIKLLFSIPFRIIRTLFR